MKCLSCAGAFLVMLAMTSLSNAGLVVEWNTLGYDHSTGLPINGVSNNGLISGAVLARGPDISVTQLGNAFSSNGWGSTDGGEYMSFSFTVANGYWASLDTFLLGTRSSDTGPGTVGLFYSGDNFTNSLATLTQPAGSSWLNSSIDLSSLGNLNGTVEFRLSKLNEGAADGGLIGNNGTFAVGRYNDPVDGPIATQLSGTVTAVPEPSSLALLSVAGVGGLAVRRLRKKRSVAEEAVSA